MTTLQLIIFISFAIIGILGLVLILQIKKQLQPNQNELNSQAIAQQIDKLEQLLKIEFSNNRIENNTAFKDTRA